MQSFEEAKKEKEKKTKAQKENAEEVESRLCFHIFTSAIATPLCASIDDGKEDGGGGNDEQQQKKKVQEKEKKAKKKELALQPLTSHSPPSPQEQEAEQRGLRRAVQDSIDSFVAFGTTTASSSSMAQARLKYN